MNALKTSVFILAVFCTSKAFSQTDTGRVNKRLTEGQESVLSVADSASQRDVIGFFDHLLNKNTSTNAGKQVKKYNFSAVPALGYTLSTGFAVDITGNAAFYTGSAQHENLSTMQADLSYDTKAQRLLFNRAEIWFPDNKYRLVTDIRWAKFPTETYGLGTLTTPAQTNEIDFNYVRIYGTLYKTLLPDFYAGAGYNLDYHCNITANGNLDKSTSDFEKYGQTATSTSSGINLDLLYDSRRNSINALGGAYANLVYRQNLTLLGSNKNWQSIELDVRRYLRLSANSNNVLAFWGMAWLSSANTPYLDLPQTAGDMYNNSGRGYAEGRFRGRDMLYLETEYRFSISRNGLFGGVVFANGQSFTDYPGNSFKGIAPGTGAGIRIKINKHSNTNVCIDYGVGTNGSHGFFVNLGEVF
ncbi:BamA/TamA family outer membrane protein [Mucilaginibacter sp. FT3.2]|uniref:BamA/TamA family outer membrane protein n=1 Tax=Mucilaginibacter sp. FT3.2 TaxID=2723090 RepID=UPI001614D2CB|nr:BamA/TamA family outer membrane protein [Mucilaginibacter sp. FT3.2]MBB6229777.1 outer membrane protein assembly factor BamA [Mucilaginibacter sp. FT3.2]